MAVAPPPPPPPHTCLPLSSCSPPLACSQPRRRPLPTRIPGPLCLAHRQSSRPDQAAAPPPPPPCKPHAPSAVPAQQQQHRPLLNSARDGRSVGGGAQVSTLKQLLTFGLPQLLLNGFKKQQQQQPIFPLDERKKLVERWEAGDGNLAKSRVTEAGELLSPRCQWPRGSSPSDLRHNTVSAVNQGENSQNLESVQNLAAGIRSCSCTADRNRTLQAPRKPRSIAATANESNMLPLQHFAGLESSENSPQPAVGPHSLWPRRNSNRQSAVADTLKIGPMDDDSSAGMSKSSSNEMRFSRESIGSAGVPIEIALGSKGPLLANIHENLVFKSASDVGSPAGSFEFSPRCSWPRKQPGITKHDHLSTTAELQKVMAKSVSNSDTRLKPALTGENHFFGTQVSPGQIDIGSSQNNAVQISTTQEEEVLHGPRCAWPRNHLQGNSEDHLNGDKESIEKRISRKETDCIWPGSLSPVGSKSQPEVGETFGKTALAASVSDGGTSDGTAKSKEVDVVGPFCDSPRIATAGISNSREKHLTVPSFLTRRKPDTIQGVQKVEFNRVSSSCLSVQQRRENSYEAEGPRCVWPRIADPASAAIHPRMEDRVAQDQSIRLQQSSCMQRVGAQPQAVSQKQQEEKEVIDGGARCAWPRSRATGAADVGKDDQLSAAPRCSWPRGLEEQNTKKQSDSSSCKELPRRMLATTVGLSLMNYFLAAQGCPAMASPIDWQYLASEFFCSEEEEEEEMESRGKTKRHEVIAGAKSLVICK